LVALSARHRPFLRGEQDGTLRQRRFNPARETTWSVLRAEHGIFAPMSVKIQTLVQTVLTVWPAEFGAATWRISLEVRSTSAAKCGTITTICASHTRLDRQPLDE
jgi:hypothetical protein